MITTRIYHRLHSISATESTVSEGECASTEGKEEQPTDKGAMEQLSRGNRVAGDNGWGVEVRAMGREQWRLGGNGEIQVFRGNAVGISGAVEVVQVQESECQRVNTKEYLS